MFDVTPTERRLLQVMTRKKRVRLSADELATAKATRDAVFGDESVALGHVIDVACRNLVAEEVGESHDDGGVNF
ncbi:helix-turn-helix domain-containing protein [Halobacterium litoreum]|uniref:Uncharacterized protein n=1 Tax=Halobacterium litoreum TaxID=2039234 RepID=A0ABD5NEE4_9EURY|nr:hypothetical protein [Halobacterium litoreum]UHH13477.1 hypothetical protein LT972_00430 [Halobacterium litoreum]